MTDNISTRINRNASENAGDRSTVSRLDAAPRWLPPLLLILTALALAPVLAPWGLMWTLALAMYFACKWATWWPNRRRGSIRRTIACLLAWPGMDARAFLGPTIAGKPKLRDWFSAIGKTFAGASLIWLVARSVYGLHPMLAGWAAMAGVALLLHFGLFHLIALAWQHHGINADPLMRRPALSRSLAEFWGRRWNTGFRLLSHELIFRPLRRSFGAAGAAGAAFMVSGLIHDLVISVPARGGYGLPTLYFIFQLLGLLIERTTVARRLGIGRGATGWFYTFCFTVIPLPLLFHAPFVHRVMLPFLHVIGAL